MMDLNTDHNRSGQNAGYVDREAVTTDSTTAVLEELIRRGETVQTHELETALTRLESVGAVSEEMETNLESLATRLVTRLLLPPARATVSAGECGDREQLQAIATLFGEGTSHSQVSPENENSSDTPSGNERNHTLESTAQQ